MNFRPIQLPVFESVRRSVADCPMPEPPIPAKVWNATENLSGGLCEITGLGHDGKAAAIKKETTLEFSVPPLDNDSIMVEILFIPTHPTDERGDLRVEVTFDSAVPTTLSYRTQGRSEEWKENVLNNHAVKSIIYANTSKRRDTLLKIRALDEGVILDQVKIYAVNSHDK